MIQTGFEKTEEELLQERAEVLRHAGCALQDALQVLHEIGRDIEAGCDTLKRCTGSPAKGLREEIGEQVGRFNEQRAYAKLRYYYLVVIREALGLRNHAWIEEIYTIPAKKTLDEQI